MFSSSTLAMAEQWILSVLLKQYVLGYLGKLNDGGTVTYYVPGRPGFTYVRVWNGELSTLDVCVNTVAPLDPNNRVWMKRVGGVLRVEFSDPITAANLYGQNVGAAGVPPHVQPLGNDPVTSDRLLPGFVGISPAGGMNVQIQGFVHAAGSFITTNLDLTAYVTNTSGDSNWAYVYVDPATNTAGAKAGSDQIAPPKYLSPSLLESIELPAGAIPLAGVALTNGQTVISDPSLIVDRRSWINDFGFLLTGDSEARTISAGAITTGDQSVIVVSPSSGTTDTLTTLTLAGAARELWLIAASGCTITLTTGGNIAVGAVCTDTQAVLIYHDGTTAYVVSGGSGGDATTVTYTPTTPADWPSVPTDVQEALDTLASEAVTGGINKDLFTQTADVTVANTTTPTTLFGTGQGSSLLPANYFVAGRTLVIDLAGYRSTALAAPNITFEVDLGSTSICLTATFADVGSLSGQQWHLHCEITCRTTGGSGSVSAQGWVELNSTSTVAIRAEMATTSTVTLDTTTSQQVKAVVTWGTASSSNTITATEARLQTVDPNAGSAGGTTHVYAGYNTIGASNEAWTSGKAIYKQFTLSADTQAVAIDVYLDIGNTNLGTHNLAAWILADNSGAPGNAVTIGTQAVYVPGNASNVGWLSLPVSAFLPAATYWLAVKRTAPGTDTCNIYYDTSGSDPIKTGLGFYANDGNYNAPNTNSTKTYSIRLSGYQ